ncbi:hypothetical protein TNCV_3134001 [Trichonephila clavipes]|nr:hypothetical protein TNCV_3134001 [Trichonephila clavipes]
MGGHVDQGCHPIISRQSESSSMKHMQISRCRELLSSVNLDSAVKSTKAYTRFLDLETYYLAHNKRALPCR